MSKDKTARLNRLLTNGRCLDIALDHGVCNEPSFLNGLEDMPQVMDKLVAAAPDAIQLNYGQADLLQDRPGRNKPALVMRIDMGNPYNATAHRVMWAVLQNEHDPVLPAVQRDAACVVVNLFMLPNEPDLFRQCVQNIARVRADCDRYGMPLMIEPLVMLPNDIRGGYQVDGDAEKIVTLVRLASEMGADIIKADPTSDPEDFHKVIEAARRPVLVRGGGREDLRVVLAKSAALMAQGANGMVYGRNIYQHDNPKAVVKALMAIIHQQASGEEGQERPPRRDNAGGGNGQGPRADRGEGGGGNGRNRNRRRGGGGQGQQAQGPQQGQGQNAGQRNDRPPRQDRGPRPERDFEDGDRAERQPGANAHLGSLRIRDPRPRAAAPGGQPDPLRTGIDSMRAGKRGNGGGNNKNRGGKPGGGNGGQPDPLRTRFGHIG